MNDESSTCKTELFISELNRNKNLARNTFLRFFKIGHMCEEIVSIKSPESYFETNYWCLLYMADSMFEQIVTWRSLSNGLLKNTFSLPKTDKLNGICRYRKFSLQTLPTNSSFCYCLAEVRNTNDLRVGNMHFP